MLLLTLALSFAIAGDPSNGLLAASAKGETTLVETLIQAGANVNAADKNGRTPLMIAAQHGHVDTVLALIDAGAKLDARDKSGLTAFDLALLNPIGHGDHEAVLKALPQHPRFTLSVLAGWSPARLVSSCFERREQAIQQFGLMRPDESLLRELQAYATASGKGLAQLVHVDAKGVELLQPEPADDADGVVTLEIEPSAACNGGTADSVAFALNLKVFRARDQTLLLQKTFGGGLKGMRAQTVENAAQYKPVYETWIKAQAGPVYWAVVEALMRAAP